MKCSQGKWFKCTGLPYIHVPHDTLHFHTRWKPQWYAKPHQYIHVFLTFNILSVASHRKAPLNKKPLLP